MNCLYHVAENIIYLTHTYPNMMNHTQQVSALSLHPPTSFYHMTIPLFPELSFVGVELRLDFYAQHINRFTNFKAWFMLYVIYNIF